MGWATTGRASGDALEGEGHVAGAARPRGWPHGVGAHPKTHSGTHNRLALHFVASGVISGDVATTLPCAARVRERTDYSAFVMTDLEAATNLLADSERFAEVVGKAARGGASSRACHFGT